MLLDSVGVWMFVSALVLSIAVWVVSGMMMTEDDKMEFSDLLDELKRQEKES